MSVPSSSPISTITKVSQSDDVKDKNIAKTETEKKTAKAFEKSVSSKKTVNNNSIYENVQEGRILPFHPLGL
ncbi:MAG: hypothetical protein COT84_03195 [Chlamydiae bacterium CG10_big_fil_rev_8_21_14_0_10_35_9]|nr:MAG: hypothetical protein COT84_03195 [Chlamydiae bacterium CG10_big_fil_rev_8_21_14_0_10_35_9]